MRTSESEKSPGDAANRSGMRCSASGAGESLGDKRTLGDGLPAQDTIIDDIEVVDFAARYKIGGTLGQRWMVAVLLATDTQLERKVVIRRILGDAARSTAAMRAFAAEKMLLFTETTGIVWLSGKIGLSSAGKPVSRLSSS